MYTNALEKHAGGEVDEILRDITAILLRKDVFKKTTDECNGCAVDDPSQKQHTCLLDWVVSVDEYFDVCYENISRELLAGLYTASQLLEDGGIVLKDSQIGLFLKNNKSKIKNLLFAESADNSPTYCFIEGFFEQLSLYIK